MSWQATNWASKQDCGGVGGKCLLYALANYADMAGRCWPSQRRLCDDTEMSERSLRTWLQTLEDHGLIETIERRRGNGTRRSDVILLKMGADSGNQDGYDSDDPSAEQPATVAACSTGNSRSTKRQKSTHQPANPAAHIENSQSEPSSEPERDAREGDEDKLPHVGAFNRKWPTASSDDQKRTKAVWDELGADDRRACLDGIEPFLKKSKADGRGHIIAGWRYIEEKRWTLLPAHGVKAETATIKPWSKAWWALMLLKIERRQPTEMVMRAGLSGYECPHDPDITPERIDALQAFPNDGEVMLAWRPWFKSHRIDLPEWHKRFWVYLPGPQPKSSTDPPKESSAA